MDYNFQIVLFKNKVKKKIINKFKTHKKAKTFFETLMVESDSVIFPKKVEAGQHSNYELSILEKTSGTFLPIFLKDEIGRQIKVELDDDNFTITKILNYNIEETFVNYQTKEKITTHQFIKLYLSESGLTLISKLNNKIIVQNDDDFNLFTFKTISDSERFIDVLTQYLMDNNKQNCLIVKDTSTTQRKYLYNLLVDKGFPKNYLLRHSTTHPE
jgi:hypothetical protein